MMTRGTVPAVTPVRLTVQLSEMPAAAPVQAAVYVDAPWVNLTVVEQLAATALHGRLLPVILKLNGLIGVLAKLTSSGVMVLTLG